jgi:hypothetical protein
LKKKVGFTCSIPVAAKARLAAQPKDAQAGLHQVQSILTMALRVRQTHVDGETVARQVKDSKDLEGFQAASAPLRQVLDIGGKFAAEFPDHPGRTLQLRWG